MTVVPLSKTVCERFVLAKHYSHRASIFWAGFGLESDGMIEGVVIYGQPSPPVQRHAFKDRDFQLFELSRLVIQTAEPNAASFLVANSLQQLLPRPCAVVSYADTEWGHCGYVYQATNWRYTGATKSHDHAYLVDGRRVHPITLRDRGISDPKRWARENNIKTIPPLPKHRYFIAVGSSRQKRKIWEKLVYPVVTPYPKLDPARYDDGPSLVEPTEAHLNNEQIL